MAAARICVSHAHPRAAWAVASNHVFCRRHQHLSRHLEEAAARQLQQAAARRIASHPQPFQSVHNILRAHVGLQLHLQAAPRLPAAVINEALARQDGRLYRALLLLLLLVLRWRRLLLRSQSRLLLRCRQL
jgi:hypothetical protein